MEAYISKYPRSLGMMACAATTSRNSLYCTVYALWLSPSPMNLGSSTRRVRQKPGGSLRHAVHLSAILLVQTQRNGFIHQVLLSRDERHDDGRQRVHLILSLQQERQRVRAHCAKLETVAVLNARIQVTDGIRVSTEHEVREPDVVRRRDVRTRNLLEQALLVQIDGVERRERAS